MKKGQIIGGVLLWVVALASFITLAQTGAFGEISGIEIFPEDQCLRIPPNGTAGNLIMCVKAYDDNATLNQEYQDGLNQ